MMEFHPSPRIFTLLVIMLVAWVLLFIYAPVIAACIGLLGIAALILRAGINGLRKGSVSINARTKFVTYNRSNNPIEFWFYVILFILIGIFACGFAVFPILEKYKIITLFQSFTK
jgi:hypothetical protein